MKGAAATTGARKLAAKQRPAPPEYLFRLFVSGLTPRSQAAIDHLNEYCGRHLAGRHRIEVVDLYQSPDLAAKEQIVATPTLLMIAPAPQRRMIGDLSQEDRFLSALDLERAPS
jgi:circadian clock protein KaiB